MPPKPTRPTPLLHRPFRGSSAIRAGLLTRAQLRSAAWRRLFRDIYIDAKLKPSYRHRLDGAALLLPPGAVISGRSAAHLFGVERLNPDAPVEILTPRRFGPVTGLAIRVGPLDEDERTVRYRIPVCSALHATWEIARSDDEMDAISWIDGLARNRAITKRALLSHAERHAGTYGHARARVRIDLCDPRAESPPESHLRVRIVQSGMPPPVPQYSVMVGGMFLARVDLAWPQWRFAVEYDGQWHVDPRQLADDRARLRALNAAGWYVYHVTREDLRNPDALLRDLATALHNRIRTFAS